MKTLLEATLLSSIMIILVMAVKAVWSNKINIKIVSFLWMLVLIRLIIPITFESPFHLDSFFPEAAVNVNQQADGNQNSDAPEHTNGTLFDFQRRDGRDLSGAAYPQETSADASKPSFWEKSLNYLKGLSLWTWAFIVWLAGSIYVLAKSVYSGVKFNLKINRTAYVKDSELNRLLDETKAFMKMHQQVYIFQSRQVDVPIVFGVFSPKIIIPARLCLSLTREKLKLIILHELCHIKRKDMLKNILWLGAKVLHWFNPFVWIAYNMHMDDIELACDEMVIGKVSEKTAFEYSQSLLDVIKLSKNMVKAPIALSFCESKNKLRKRVMNMVKPQRKLKSAGFMSLLLAIFMVIGGFTTACQPTPEKTVVKNKGDGRLESAIKETAEPTPEGAQATEEPKQEIRITDTKTNNAGTITVNVDAKVVPEGNKKITVARLKSYYYTPEEMDRIVKIFFGGDITYYDHLTKLKSGYEDAVVYLKQKLTLPDEELLALYQDRGLTDVDEIKKSLNDGIEDQKEKGAKAPETAEVIEKFEVRSKEWGGFYADVDFGRDYLGYVNYDEPFAGRVTFSCNAFKGEFAESKKGVGISFTVKMDVDTSGSEFAQAKENAQNLIDAIGIDGVELGDVYISVGEAKDNSTGEIFESGKEFYVFCFERTVGERTIDYTFFDGGHTDDYEVTRSVPYEKIEVWTDGAEPVNFCWKNPLETMEVVNDNAAIQVDYSQAMELAINQIFAKYAYELDSGRAVNLVADISGIEFEMVRMKEKDTDNYISVPAWKIYGDVQMQRSQAELDHLKKYVAEHPEIYYNIEIDLSEYISLSSHDGPNLVTVNALDGSIIDMGKGY